MRRTAHHTGFLYRLIPLILVAFLLSVCLPCPPVNAEPVLSVAPPSGPAGISVTITGSVFDSYEGDIIHILFDTTEISEPVIIPPEGTFSVSCAIPASAAPGQHLIGVKRETAGSSFFFTVPFIVEQPQLTLDINEGTVGSYVTLRGSGFTIDKAVTLDYFNPFPSTIGTVTVSASGKFSFLFTIPAGITGRHRIRASNVYGSSAEADFMIIPEITLNLDEAPPGDLLNMTGTGFSSQSIIVISLGASNIATAIAGDAGSFEVYFIVPEVKPMSYSIKAQDNRGNIAKAGLTVTAYAVLSEIYGSVGNAVTVRGSGFSGGETVTIYYDGEPIAVAVADNNGDFITAFDVPPSDSGEHIITVSGATTTITREYPYTVEAVAPASPGLFLPAHNGITGAYTYFQWQSVTDTSVPVTYELEISSDRNFSDIILQKTGITDSQYTLTGDEALASGSTDLVFFWRVRAVDGAGNRSSWSETRSFYVDIPKAPALLLPANEAVVEFPLRLSWETVTSLSAPLTYTLQVSRNIEFNELLLDEKGLTSPDYVIPEESKKIFNKDIPYFWRVKAVDNAGNTGGWSAVGSFNIVRSGFPVWATVILIILAAVILVLLAFRYGRRSAYH